MSSADVELTAAAIARRAGVGRAAVSNWRRRYPDFPEPVGGTEASPTFSQAAVDAWLRATGKADQLAVAGQTDTGTQRITAAERSLTDLTRAELLDRIIVALLPREVTDPEDELPVVLDPCCAAGNLLMAVTDRFGDRVALAGQEIDARSASAAALNLRDNAHGVRYEIHTGDSLRDDQLGTAAAVVCEPPFDQPAWPTAELTSDSRWEFGIPAPRDGELAWVQHCYAHLRPRGVAVVAVSTRMCVQPSGGPIRAALIRSGVLREVIALPKDMSSVPGTDICLWYLQRPHGKPDLTPVRMIDVSHLADPADAPLDFAAWERLREVADPAITTAVERLNLLDGDTNLLPSRYIAPPASTDVGELADVTSRLEGIYASIGRGLPRYGNRQSPGGWGWQTIAELERVGALTIRPREVTPAEGDLLIRTLGRPPIVATGDPGDDTGIAHIVEIDDTRLDPHFVATFLRVDANATPVANTLGAVSRDDLRRCRIPRMPLGEQRRYGHEFRMLRELQGALADLSRISNTVIEQTIHGLTSGALTPERVVMKKGEGNR
jgi:hypothetical protein